MKKANKISLCLAMLPLIVLSGCSKHADSNIRRVESGKESGFLGDYASLKPNTKLGSDILTYVNTDEAKNLRRYVGIIVDPVEVYLAADADPTQFQAKAGAALARYFERALKNSVGDAFQVVDQPGPLVLRLRTAIVGVGVGAEQSKGADDPGEALDRAAKIDQVHIELELVDSESGERIAAAVDNAALGAAAEVGAVRFERMQKFAAAREALDEWASRVREFLDVEHEITGDDARKAVDSYQPYGVVAAAGK